MGRGWHRRFSTLCVALLAVASTGCVAKSRSAADDRGKSGGVEVVVHDLSDEEKVHAVQVTLAPQGAGAPLVRDLPTPPPGQPWSGTLASIPPGTYTATASAFDEAEQLLFQSAPSAPFLVEDGSTPQVHLILHQHRAEDPFVAPYVASIHFDSEPMEGKSAEIIVRGEGGVGKLTLGGSGDGGFANATGDAKEPAGASIHWTPGGTGPRLIFLELEDEAGNRAAHALTVVVSGAEGSVDLDVHFNHAPFATNKSTSTVADDSTGVRLETRFRDGDSTHVSYDWDFSDCENAGLSFDPGSSDASTGTVVQDSTRLFWLRAPDGQARSCVAHLLLTDNGAGPSVQRQTVTVNTELTEADCAQGLTACFGVCTDTQVDREHCGACYNICGLGEKCEGGSCVQACAGDLAFCDGDCVDLESDPDFCGGCSNACRADQVCSDGLCACPGGWLVCDEVCTDVSTSDAHCGGCDNACAGGMTCTGGACACPAPLSECGGACVDQESDDQNCGGCDNACTGGKSCTGGTCACPAPLSECGGACVDQGSDNQHCGGCGNVCPAGQHCSGGGCACDTPGLTACGALCVDTQTDPNHCGGCGPTTACDEGEVCEGGTCIAAGCPEGQDACGPGGACVDILFNESHCGGCNQPCNTYDHCVNGVCMPDPEYANWPVPSEAPLTSHYDTTTYPGIVYDTITKLMWQRSPPQTTVSQAQAIQACKNLTLGGFTDWRLPTRIELISITQLTSGSSPKQNPAINNSVFLNTANAGYWTTTPYLDNPGTVWMVSFSLGNAGWGMPTGNGYYRCVRYGPGYRTRAEMPPNRYTNYGGYIRDNYTGLNWEQGSYVDQPLWAEAACKTLYFGGYQAMLPFRKQLETLVDPRQLNPAMTPGTGFAYHNDEYWTRTLRENFGGSEIHYWLIDFRNGRTDSDWQGYYLATRCVAGPYY